jgi:hypothetical protein
MTTLEANTDRAGRIIFCMESCTYNDFDLLGGGLTIWAPERKASVAGGFKAEKVKNYFTLAKMMTSV